MIFFVEFFAEPFCFVVEYVDFWEYSVFVVDDKGALFHCCVDGVADLAHSIEVLGVIYDV